MTDSNIYGCHSLLSPFVSCRKAEAATTELFRNQKEEEGAIRRT